jgi:hypothetical protein
MILLTPGNPEDEEYQDRGTVRHAVAMTVQGVEGSVHMSNYISELVVHAGRGLYR